MENAEYVPLEEARHDFQANGHDEATALTSVTVHEFLEQEIKPREMVLSPILPTQGLALLYSRRGVGKTHGSLGIAYAVATGSEFLNWEAPKARRVLFVDGEMPAVTLQERLAWIVAGAEKELPAPDYLRVITPDLQSLGIPDLASQQGQDAIEAHMDGVEFLVLDNLSTLCSFGRENESESWSPVQRWMLNLRSRGVAVLLVHHAGKAGAQRGTSRREDVLDTVINLRHPEDYSPEDGARFEVHFEKARGFMGDDAKPFEAKLEVRNEKAIWITRALEDVELAQVVELTGQGMSVREIADETSFSKSKVNRLQQRAKNLERSDEGTS